MQSNVSLIILVIVFVLIGMMLPLYNLYLRQDNISFTLALKSTNMFVDEVKNKGYITAEMYDEFLLELLKTNRDFDITLEAHRKMFIEDSENPGKYIEEYAIDYDNDIFEVINDTSTPNEEGCILSEKAYLFDEGDQIYVKIKNEDQSIADKLLDALILNDTRYNIVINLGGFITNTTWENAREEF